VKVPQRVSRSPLDPPEDTPPLPLWVALPLLAIAGAAVALMLFVLATIHGWVNG
jgi:hypothetical protein